MLTAPLGEMMPLSCGLSFILLWHYHRVSCRFGKFHAVKMNLQIGEIQGLIPLQAEW